MENAHKPKLVLVGLLAVLCLVALAACTPTENTSQVDPGPTHDTGVSNDQGAAPEEGETPSQDLVLAAWEGGPHADSFVVDAAGENNLCGRCHAPVNWQPTLDDIPPSCFTCKFELEEPDPLIPEENWADIPCHVCHEKDKKGNVRPEVMWLEIPAFEEYVAVDSVTELCQKCHGESGYEEHGIVEVGGVHGDYGCMDCHDPHDTLASCSDAGCHEDVVGSAAGTPGHDEDHVSVSCAACHDGGGMSVGFREEDQVFMTMYTLVRDEGESSFPFTSHKIVLESDCDRCHFAANPWNISETVTRP